MRKNKSLIMMKGADMSQYWVISLVTIVKPILEIMLLICAIITLITFIKALQIYISNNS